MIGQLPLGEDNFTYEMAPFYMEKCRSLEPPIEASLLGPEFHVEEKADCLKKNVGMLERKRILQQKHLAFFFDV